AVLLDETQELGVDGRPDRASRALGARPEEVGSDRARTGLPHVLDRDHDLEVELLRPTGVDELDRPRARDEAADLLEWTLRRRQADALHRLSDQAVEALDRQCEMGAALRTGDGV